MRRFVALLFLLWATAAHAGVSCSLPFTLTNGTTADATQVMANYNALVACLNNAAAAGANFDITSLNALTTPLPPAQGGSNVFIGTTNTGGTANAQTLTATAPSGFALTNGWSLVVTIGTGLTNTGPATLTVGSTSTITIFKPQATGAPIALTGSELQAASSYILTYFSALNSGAGGYLLMGGNPGGSAAKDNTVVGSVRNLKSYLTTAGVSITITADEIVTETALGGTPYKEASASHTLNISTTGAGGMDTGSAPTSGFVCVYSITKGDGATYNVLGQNASTTGCPSIYGGANMPSGYIASGLIAIWPTDSTPNLKTGWLKDRHFAYQSTTAPKVLSNVTGTSTLTSLSISTGVPPNATGTIILADFFMGGHNTSTRMVPVVAGDANGTGGMAYNFANSSVPPGTTTGWLNGAVIFSMASFNEIPCFTSQTLYWADSAGVGDDGWILGYSF